MIFDIFTTINPNENFDNQNEAILSWSTKYKVYSVNTKNDIEKINNLYPSVIFIETEDIYIHKEKQLIKLNAILNAVKSKSIDNCIIVNSDIILKNDIILNEKYLENGLIIGSRYEISDDKPAYEYDSGYDIFIFNKKYTDCFYNKNYVIGMPWWDFWIPIIANKYPLSVYHISYPIFYHNTHKINYDLDTWIKFGEYLYIDVMVNMLKNPMNISINDFCVSIKSYIEKKIISISNEN